MRRKFSFNRPNLLLPLVIHILWSLLLWLSYLPIADQTLAAAPITPSGLNTQVSQPVTLPTGQTQYNITGGTRPGSGTNLFHSFGDFNVPNNNIANFLNDSGLATSNILGRVTGGNISNIFGTIQTTNFGNANLFLMNPAGFLFGPNATVNVGGMVAFTSADYLRLGDGKLFNAIPNANADAILSAAPVAAFGFLGSNPGAITVQGSQLSVTPGQSLSLVGGNITVQSGTLDNGAVQAARLSAQGGQINLASVASPGEILMGTLAQSPNINGQSFGNLGTIQITEQSLIDVSGNGGGTVLIRGGQFLLDNSTISANVTGPGPVINGAESIGSGIDIQVSQNAVIQNLGVLETSVTGNATPGVQYGGVHVKADRIEILGTITFEDALVGNGDFSAVTGIRSNVSPGSTGGNSGSITLDANSVLINNFAQVQTDTEGAGNAGNILIRANQNIDTDFGQITSGQSGMLLAQPATGDAGNIELTSAHGNISLTRFSNISSTTVNSPGTAGTITLSAPRGDILVGDLSVVFTLIQPPINANGVPAVRAGGSGGILFNANNLEVRSSDIGITNGSNLPSGDLTVNLSGNLSVRGGDFGPSLIHALAQGPAPSAGMNITAHDVLITDGSALTTSTVTAGAAGPLNISAVNVQLTNGGEISSASRQGLDLFTGLPSGPSPTGSAGTVTIKGLTGPADSVLIDGAGSRILTNTEGAGAGGNINILANTLTLQNGGTLSAATSGTAPSATGGTILVKADTVTLTTGGTLTAASTGAGPSGEVVVQGLASPAQSILIDGAGSGIFTDTQGAGAGGDIHLFANSVTLQHGGTLSATTSGAGNGGNIEVDATTINLLSLASINTLSFLNSGSAGNIALKATQQITAVDPFLNTDAVFGTGSGGDILLHAPTIGMNGGVLSTSTTGDGQAGNILLEGQHISLGASPASGQGVLLSASTNFGSGHGGTITLRGLDGPSSHADTVTISGSSLLQTLTGAGGSAGDITINAAQFTLADHSKLSADTFGSGGAGSITITATDSATVSGNGSTVSSSSDFGATGSAGQITISAPTMMIENGGLISTTTTGAGTGGNINVVAGGSVTLTNGASISSSSTGTGKAGDITINAGQAFTATNSQVTTEADQSSGGAIKITTAPNGTVRLTDSMISASVLDGTGGGGSVTIDPQFVVLQNSQILANAVQGPGGKISITTNLLLPDTNSVISASSQFGQQGTITIQSPISPASGKIVPLSQKPLIPTSLLSQRCAALAGGTFSSFTVAGRDSLPAEPGGWLSSPLAVSLSKSGGGTLTEAGPRASLSEPTGEIPLLSLRQIAPPGFLTQAFAVDWSTGCKS